MSSCDHEFTCDNEHSCISKQGEAIALTQLQHNDSGDTGNSPQSLRKNAASSASLPEAEGL